VGQIERQLTELGWSLPPAKEPVADYVGCKRSGKLLFVSALVSRTRGAAGVDVDLNGARDAARETVLGLLAIVRSHLGDLDRVAAVEKMNGFVRSGPEFTQQPQVVDGASEVLTQLFGEAGRHARTATGVYQLPYGATVQLEMILRLHD
jgi:enamine deaminase RidA (YjgF/YER057c/UK114 family)